MRTRVFVITARHGVQFDQIQNLARSIGPDVQIECTPAKPIYNFMVPETEAMLRMARVRFEQSRLIIESVDGYPTMDEIPA